jgi:hypothetical protein
VRKGKPSSAAWGALGAAGLLVAAIAGSLWWANWRGLPAQGVEGPLTQGSLRVVARHRERARNMKANPAPHPALRYVYDRLGINWRPSPVERVLEIESAVPFPTTGRDFAPEGCTAVATTPGGRKFALEFEPNFYQMFRASIQRQRSRGQQFPPLPGPRALLVRLPDALPGGVEYLDVTVTTPVGGRGTWRVRDFKTLPRKIPADARPVTEVTAEGVRVRAAAWTQPMGYPLYGWRLPNGNTIYTGKGNTGPPRPGATPFTRMGDPDRIKVALWTTGNRDASPVPSVGNDPPLTHLKARIPPRDLQLTRVATEWEAGAVSYYPGRTFSGFSSSAGGVQSVRTLLGTPAFGGEQKLARVEASLTELVPAVLSFPFRNVRLNTAGNTPRLAAATAPVGKDDFTVRLLPTVPPDALTLRADAGAKAGARSVRFAVEYTLPPELVAPVTYPAGSPREWIEVLYRDAANRWARAGGSRLYLGRRTRAVAVRVPVPSGANRLPEVVVAVAVGWEGQVTPLTFVVPVTLGDPPDVPTDLRQ